MFVYAIPDDATSLLCTIKADTPIETTLEIDFLRSLGESFGPDSGDDPAEIAASIHELPGSVARVRLAQLAGLNSAPGPASRSDADPGAKAVVAALAHPERATRTAAFGFLESGELLSDEALDGIAEAESKRVYETIIAGTAAAVARAQLIDTTAGVQARSQRPRGQGLDTIVPSDLPDSAVSPNVFDVLGAVLGSKAAGNGTEGLDLILLDRSRQSVSALARVSRRVQASAIRRLDSLDDPELAEPIVKTLLLTPAPTLVKLLLDRARRLTITINDVNDPLLTAPMRAKDPVVQIALLGALAQLPLDDVFDSRTVRNMLSAVTGPEVDTRVYLAAIALIDRHWKPAVDLPVVGQARSRQLRAPRTGVELILYDLAASPIDEGAVAAGQKQAAAAAITVLARKGLVDEASAAIREQEPAHGAAILAVLANAYPPDAPPNLGVVLGDAASDEDPGLATAAIVAILQGFQVTPPNDQWRYVSALKAGLSFEGLLQHTVIREQAQKALSNAALDVIAAAATLSPEDAKEFRTRPNVAKRTEHLAQINAALVAEKLPGAYRAIVSLDVRVPSAVPTAAATSAGSRNRSDGGSRNRGSGAGPGGTDTVYDVSYDVGPIEIVKVDAENFAMKIGAQTLPIEIVSAQGRPGTLDTRAIMTFDAAALVRAALGQPTGAARAVTATIPAGEVTALADTGLDYVAFGRWQGTIDLSRLTQGPGGTARTWPEALDRIRIIIDRVAQP